MTSSTKQHIKHGSILAITSILVRIIGMVYRIPMTDIIGDRGNGIYAGAFEIYNIILLISTYSMPMAVSKVVSYRLAARDFLNSYKFFKIALSFAICSGIVFSSLAYFGSDFLAGTLMKSPMSSIALRVLAPTILIVSIMGVIRGFFQATGSMIPTSISQIIEQIINAVVSVVAAYYLFQYGIKLANATGNSDFSYAYGAAGGTLGTLTGALGGLLFLLFANFIYITYLKGRIKRQRRKRPESSISMLGLLVLTILPVILSTAIYNVNTILSQGIYYNIQFAKGVSVNSYESIWGIYTGKYRLLTNVPMAIASSMAASAVPMLSIMSRQKASKSEINEKLKNTVQMVMLVIMPCILGLTVLSHPIINLLFRGTLESQSLAGNMLLFGSSSILFITLSTLSTGFLQGLSKMKEPVIHSAIALVIQLIVFRLLLNVPGLGIYAMIISNILFGFLVSCMNNWSLYKLVGYNHNWIKSFVKPLFASIIMGALTYGTYYVVMLAIHKNSIAVLVAIVMAMIYYYILIIVLKVVTKEELAMLPRGHRLVRIGELIRLW